MWQFTAVFPLLVLVLLSAGTDARKARTTISNTCPRHILKAEGSYYFQINDGICYQFALDQKKSYQDAQQTCVQNGGNLAMPKTRDINDFLVRELFWFYLEDYPVWIGLNDRVDEGVFVWEDGDRLKYKNKYFAKQNGPRNSKYTRHVEDCIALDPLNGKWNDFICSTSRVIWRRQKVTLGYVCQYTNDNEDKNGPTNTPARHVVATTESPVDNRDSTVAPTDTATTDDNQNTEIYGTATTDDNQNTEIYGTATTEDNQNTEIYGTAATDDNENTEFYGTATTEDNQNTEIYGTATPDDNQNTEIYGTATTEDNQSSPIYGTTKSDKIDNNCPLFDCNLDCSWYGYVVDVAGCPTCECSQEKQVTSSK